MTTAHATAAETMPASLEPPVHDPRRRAKFLYWMGWDVKDVAAFLGEKYPTVASWKARDKWDESSPLDRVEGALEARLVQLIVKESKTGGDFKEIDLLGRQLERTARVRRFNAPGGHEGDLNPRVQDRALKAAKHRPKVNFFSEEQIAELEAKFRQGRFQYQDFWEAAGINRTRLLLKSRQIGATWYFAREALVDAVTTGRNQIVLSASKAQAHVWKQYMVEMALEVGVKLTGDPITLWNGATLYFLGTNFRTAQGYHGNFYFDEFFWTFKFEQLNKVASMMAAQKAYRETYLSSPSSVSHEAYPFFTGANWNKGRPKDQQKQIDISHAALKHGVLGPDGIFRHMLRIDDAIEQGFDLIDVERLQARYSPTEYANLMMCEFVDDATSAFPFALIRPAMIDSWEVWREDFFPLQARPYRGEVWIGYDPSYKGDNAALVVVAPPATAGGRFRILEKHTFSGQDFAAQANAIERLTKKYQVSYIGIDSTGIGQAVLQLVKIFFPRVRALHYSAELKSLMVMKAQDVMRKGRLQFDAGWTDVAHSFMSIRPQLTESGRQITYVASRTGETGHADLAWATMHALFNEPLEAGRDGGRRASMMEIT